MYIAILILPFGQLVDIGDFPGGYISTTARAVSADGTTVVGSSIAIAGVNEAFRWQNRQIGSPLFQGDAFGVSADGSVVVGWQAGVGAVRWRDEFGGQIARLGDLPGGQIASYAYACSADGSLVAGMSNSYRGDEPFRWTAEEGMVSLGRSTFRPGSARAVSGDGQWIAGEFDGDLFLWSYPTGIVVLDYDRPGAISFDGRFVSGNYYIWDRLENRRTMPFGMIGSISDDGNVGGVATYGAVWDRLHGLRDVEAAFIEQYGLDTTGWSFENVTGVSADGLTLVGNAGRAGVHRAGWIVTLPWPLNCRAGDVNDDGAVDYDDMPDFIAAVLAGSGPARCGYDVHPDGKLDGRDVRAFIEKIRR